MTFGPDHILFASYQFPSASVHPHGVLPATQIRSAWVESSPPEIHTSAGETLFLSSDDRAGLAEFCARHSIPLVGRLDIWGNLFEPFLDTEFGPEHQSATACCGTMEIADYGRV